jgi:hypothetical protein
MTTLKTFAIYAGAVILGSMGGIRNSQRKQRGCIAQSELTFSLR